MKRGEKRIETNRIFALGLGATPLLYRLPARTAGPKRERDRHGIDIDMQRGCGLMGGHCVRSRQGRYFKCRNFALTGYPAAP
jgi:hypothetical protein